MPKILVFAPCEKVIVNQLDNTTSVISILEGLTIDIPEGALSPDGTSIPIKWHILSLWEKVEGEEERKFEQRLELVLPSGVNRFDMTSALDFEPEPRRFRMVTMVTGFPLSPAGACILKLSVREVGHETWQHVDDFPIYITRPSAPQNPEAVNEKPRAEVSETG